MESKTAVDLSASEVIQKHWNDKGSKHQPARGNPARGAKLNVHTRTERVTTRQISKLVGCSEGALYVHFEGRLELLLAMPEECLPDALQSLRALEESCGHGSPQKDLVTAINGIYGFHKRVVPLLAGLFAEPKLLSAYRKSLISRNKGPHLAIAALERYIKAEQRLARIDKQINANLAATVLLSSCFLRAFAEHFVDRPMQPRWNQFAAQLVGAIIHSP